MPETYQFEQLDAETRAYLLLARDKDGKGLPGLYSARPNYLPVIGLAVGVGLIILTLIFTFPPTDPPTQEALLQTAGFLMGLWLVVAALRVLTAGAAGRYAGHFVYADPEALYEVSGSTVRVTDLADLREAKATQNFNEGNYQNTSITVRTAREQRTFEVRDEERGRRMTVYLSAVAHMRAGGEDGNERRLKTLTPEEMGAMAKEVATTGQFPRSVPREGNEVTRIPRPRKDGRASTGLLAILLWGLIGVGMFFGFRAINVPFRDEIVFGRIEALPPRYQPPALRVYLANPDFTAHRARAQDMLGQAYETSAREYVRGDNAALAEALRELVRSLKTREPVVSLIAAEMKSPPADFSGGLRDAAVRTALADRWASTIGDELIVFVTPTRPDSNGPDTTRKGMIDVRWWFKEARQIEYTIEFRKTPDDEPYAAETFQLAADSDPTEFARLLGANILTATIGRGRDRPKEEGGDF